MVWILETKSPVSYTHLDVYKRQKLSDVNGNAITGGQVSFKINGVSYITPLI